MSELSEAVERKIAEYIEAGMDSADASMRAITEATIEKLKQNGVSKKKLAEWEELLDEVRGEKKREKTHLLRVRDGDAARTIERALEARENFNFLVQEGYSVSPGGKDEIIFESKSKDSVAVFSNAGHLMNASPTAAKLFRYILSEVNYCIAGGEVLPGRDGILLSYEDLSEGEGAIYKDRNDARRAIEDDLRAMTSLIVTRYGYEKVEDEKPGGNRKQKKKRVMLFSGSLFTAVHERGRQRVILNADAPWDKIVPYITILPIFYLELPKTSSELLSYLYGLAQVKASCEEDIEAKDENGNGLGFISFAVSLETIRQRLFLPDPSETKNARRDILERIDSAAATINTKTKDIQVALEEGPGRKLEEIIAGGKVKIEIKGEYAEPILAIMRSKLLKRAKELEAEEKKNTKLIAKIAKNANKAESKKVFAKLEEHDAAIAQVGKGVHVVNSKQKQLYAEQKQQAARLDAMEAENQRKDENL